MACSPTKHMTTKLDEVRQTTKLSSHGDQAPSFFGVIGDGRPPKPDACDAASSAEDIFDSPPPQPPATVADVVVSVLASGEVGDTGGVAEAEASDDEESKVSGQERAAAKRAEKKAKKAARDAEEAKIMAEGRASLDGFLTTHDTSEDAHKRIQFSNYNSKPARRRHYIGSGRLDDPSRRRARVIAYRWIDNDEEGNPIFDYGATIYTPPVVHVKKRGGAYRREPPSIPKHLVPMHRLTAAQRCCEAGLRVRVKMPPGQTFEWNARCLRMVRHAIHTSMTEHGVCGPSSVGL